HAVAVAAGGRLPPARVGGCALRAEVAPEGVVAALAGLPPEVEAHVVACAGSPEVGPEVLVRRGGAVVVERLVAMRGVGRVVDVVRRDVNGLGGEGRGRRG